MSYILIRYPPNPCTFSLKKKQVEDYRDGNQDEMEPYAVERIATVLAVTCMFLSVLYAMFAVLLFLAYASDHAPSTSESNEDSKNHSNSQFILDDRTNSPFMLSSEQDVSSSRPSDHRHSQFIIPAGEEPKVGQFMTMS
jgi:hypothetical protein